MGKDPHKPGQPEVPEMGGLALLASFTAGVLLAVALEAFSPSILPVDFVALFAVLSTVLLTRLIGILDELLDLRQGVKAFLPVIAALLLVAIRAGQTTLTMLFGARQLFYPLVLVPLGITGAASAVNMLAGFNGVELGMGFMAMAGLSAVAWKVGSAASLVILFAGMGATLGLLLFNGYPARVFVGDFEFAGLVIIAPYALDFLIKAAHRFPSRGWSGVLKEDRRL